MPNEKDPLVAVVKAFNATLIHRSLYSHVQPILDRLGGHITVSGMQAAKYGLTRVIPDIRDASTQAKSVARQAAGTALEGTVGQAAAYLDGLAAACSALWEVIDAGRTADIPTKLGDFAALTAAASAINRATEAVIDGAGMSDTDAGYAYRDK